MWWRIRPESRAELSTACLLRQLRNSPPACPEIDTEPGGAGRGRDNGQKLLITVLCHFLPTAPHHAQAILITWKNTGLIKEQKLASWQILSSTDGQLQVASSFHFGWTFLQEASLPSSNKAALTWDPAHSAK